MKGFKNVYADLISYPEIPELAMVCIDTDIKLFNLLISEDANSIYSSAYFENYNNFQTIYSQIKDKKESLLTERINYGDEKQKYMD